MVNLSIEETSGVDHPAHLHEGWLVMKSADESEVQNVLDETLTEEESMPDNSQDNVTPTATDEQVEVLAETTEVAKAEITEEEFLKSAPESVVKMIADLRKSADDANALLQAERDSRADAEAIEKAKGWANLNLDAEKVGPALRRLATTDADLAKSFEEILSSVNAQAESAHIFAEIGKSADFKSGNAYERMSSLAKSAVEEGVSKSFEQALADIATKNPDLYNQYLTEKKGA